MKKVDIHRSSGVSISRNTKTLRVYTDSNVNLVRARRITKDDLTDALIAQIQEYRQNHLNYNSSLERMFMEKTKEFGIPFKREVYFNIGNTSYYLDFLCEEDNVAVEIDGPQHRNIRAQKWDLNRDKVFAFIGIRTIRFNEKEVKSPRFKDKFLTRYFGAKKEAPLLKEREYALKVISSYKSKRNKVIEQSRISCNGLLAANSKGEMQLFTGLSYGRLKYDVQRDLWFDLLPDGYMAVGEPVVVSGKGKGLTLDDSPMCVRIAIQMLGGAEHYREGPWGYEELRELGTFK